MKTEQIIAIVASCLALITAACLVSHVYSPLAGFMFLAGIFVVVGVGLFVRHMYRTWEKPKHPTHFYPKIHD